MLMLFLLSIYHGVADGSVQYVRQNRADLWVLQEHATNILRVSSILTTAHGQVLAGLQRVRATAPILFVLATIRQGAQRATVYVAGYDPETGMGGPPGIIDGREVASDDEIVLDRSFAAKLGLRVGDTVRMQHAALRVVGLSNGTNMFVIQYAFVTYRRAQLMLGVPGLVTCYMVRAQAGTELASLKEEIRAALPRVEVYEHEEFLQNNTREMEAGILPLLYSVAVIGAVVLTVILSLLLSINVLERRKDFAVLKTLGSPRGFLPRLIVEQALAVALAGSAVALGLFFPMVAVIERLAPEVSTQSSVEQVALVILAVGLVSLLAALFSLQKLRSIYPLEAFQ
jgi:putative ABC transport system permease protein